MRTPPPQRLILRPTNLAGLGINIALKLRRRAPPHIRMELLALPDLLAVLEADLWFRRIGRLVDFHSDGWLRCGLGVGGGLGLGLREGAGALLLQLFEELLFFFGQAGWAGAAEGRGLVGGGCAEGGGAAGELAWELSGGA